MAFEINDYLLTKECDELAQEIFDEAEDKTDLEAMGDRAHETADGHEWVIYTHKAIMLCAHCDTTAGEEFLEDVGMPETPTFGGLATMIAYGEMRHRIDEKLAELVEAHEEDEGEEEQTDA